MAVPDGGANSDVDLHRLEPVRRDLVEIEVELPHVVDVYRQSTRTQAYAGASPALGVHAVRVRLIKLRSDTGDAPNNVGHQQGIDGVEVLPREVATPATLGSPVESVLLEKARAYRHLDRLELDRLGEHRGGELDSSGGLHDQCRRAGSVAQARESDLRQSGLQVRQIEPAPPVAERTHLLLAQ